MVEGIFCANFASSRGGFRTCRQVWCENCCRPPTQVRFHVNKPYDVDGFEWLKKGDENQFMVGRNGDNFLSLFQCDLCVFRNIHKRDPLEMDGDALSLCCIRCANLDALWLREPSTVRNNLRLLKKGLGHDRSVDQDGHCPELGPMPMADVIGQGVAAQVLLASLEEGKHYKDHKQHDTVRKLRSVCSSLWMASQAGSAHVSSTCRNHKGESVLLTSSPTDSEWHKRFDRGLVKRMGQDVRPQLGFSIDVMLILMKRLERLWEETVDERSKDAMLGAATRAFFEHVNELRRNEGFKADLGGA